MNPTPYLIFQGTCREAMETYAGIFGGQIDMMMRASEMPGFEVPPGKEDWIAHAGLVFDGGMLMASDDITGGTGAMDGCSVYLGLPTTPRARDVFDALADGGAPRMDFQATFWSPGFGTLTDKFGVQWMISSEEPVES